jgi:hypothetical protein
VTSALTDDAEAATLRERVAMLEPNAGRRGPSATGSPLRSSGCG